MLDDKVVQTFYHYLQQQTRCMSQIEPEIDRGYGSFTTAIDGRRVNVDVHTVGAATDRVMDLVLRFD